MIERRVSHIWLLFCCFLLVSSVAFAQPKEIRKPGDVRIVKTKRKFDRINDHLATGEVTQQVVTFEITRLLSARFPSVAFSYQRFLGDLFSVQGTLGLPINRLDVYREVRPSRFPGVEAGVGGRIYFSRYTRSRFYAAVDAAAVDNTVRANAFVQEPDKISYRLRELDLNRRRQLLAGSIGYQLITLSGFSLDLKTGLTIARSGVFAANGVEYLDEIAFETFLGGSRRAPNEWGRYTSLRLTVGLGYSF